MRKMNLGFPLLHGNPVAVELLVGLIEVASVGPQSCGPLGDDGRPGTSTETAYKLSTMVPC